MDDDEIGNSREVPRAKPETPAFTKRRTLFYHEDIFFRPVTQGTSSAAAQTF